MQLSPAYVYELAASSPCEMTLYALVSVYVATSLTIPYWVPIVKAYLGQTGVYWVFATLTYYAYLAWLIFAALLAYMLLRVPLAGALWLGVLALRGAQFVRLCRRRAPPPHRMACSSADSRSSNDSSTPEILSEIAELCCCGRSRGVG